MRGSRRGTYRLVYQDQPGKGYLNTYRAAKREERERWEEELKDDDLAVSETAGLRGEVGPESESEADEPMPEFDDADVLIEKLARQPIKPSHRLALKRVWDAVGGDFDAREKYASERKRQKRPDEEQKLDFEIDAVANFASRQRNMAIRRKLKLTNRRPPS